MKRTHFLSIMLLTAPLAQISAVPRAALYSAIRAAQPAGDLNNFSEMPLWMLDETLAGAVQVLNENYSKDNMLSRYGVTKKQLHQELAKIRASLRKEVYSQTDGKATQNGMVAIDPKELERLVKEAEQQLIRALKVRGKQNKESFSSRFFATITLNIFASDADDQE